MFKWRCAKLRLHPLITLCIKDLWCKKYHPCKSGTVFKNNALCTSAKFCMLFWPPFINSRLVISFLGAWLSDILVTTIFFVSFKVTIVRYGLCQNLWFSNLNIDFRTSYWDICSFLVLNNVFFRRWAFVAVY